MVGRYDQLKRRMPIPFLFLSLRRTSDENIIYEVLNTRTWFTWNTHVNRLRSRSRGMGTVIIVFIMSAQSCFVISPLGSFEVSTHGMDKVYHTSNGCNLSLRFVF
ncbi:hypothetical protein BDW42DRAFT_176348 [Aspergillus taichungensis]|uniref:Uncharacterized protein n=1 Tax=Aspergillus taichungensis TaxID=482145 RepID=A0A2J5HKY7_9EURO|nr:hypothetical protein BDW42DRAFT_176348 [Aspergillus taichungensis]